MKQYLFALLFACPAIYGQATTAAAASTADATATASKTGTLVTDFVVEKPEPMPHVAGSSKPQREIIDFVPTQLTKETHPAAYEVIRKQLDLYGLKSADLQYSEIPSEKFVGLENPRWQGEQVVMYFFPADAELFPADLEEDLIKSRDLARHVARLAKIAQRKRTAQFAPIIERQKSIQAALPRNNKAVQMATEELKLVKTRKQIFGVLEKLYAALNIQNITGRYMEDGAWWDQEYCHPRFNTRNTWSEAVQISELHQACTKWMLMSEDPSNTAKKLARLYADNTYLINTIHRVRDERSASIQPLSKASKAYEIASETFGACKHLNTTFWTCSAEAEEYTILSNAIIIPIDLVRLADTNPEVLADNLKNIALKMLLPVTETLAEAIHFLNTNNIDKAAGETFIEALEGKLRFLPITDDQPTSATQGTATTAATASVEVDVEHTSRPIDVKLPKWMNKLGSKEEVLEFLFTKRNNILREHRQESRNLIAKIKEAFCQNDPQRMLTWDTCMEKVTKMAAAESKIYKDLARNKSSDFVQEFANAWKAHDPKNKTILEIYTEAAHYVATYRPRLPSGTEGQNVQRMLEALGIPVGLEDHQMTLLTIPANEKGGRYLPIARNILCVAIGKTTNAAELIHQAFMAQIHLEERVDAMRMLCEAVNYPNKSDNNAGAAALAKKFAKQATDMSQDCRTLDNMIKQNARTYTMHSPYCDTIEWRDNKSYKKAQGMLAAEFQRYKAARKNSSAIATTAAATASDSDRENR
jgi:hypothetical protein